MDTATPNRLPPGRVDDERNCILEDPINGHGLAPIDPDNPMMWTTSKRVYASACAWFYVFTILYATTTYTALLPAITKTFDVTQQQAIIGFANPFFGVFFAPLITPHLAEKYGRRPIYSASFALFAVCVLVLGLTTDFSTLLAFRFLAGLVGGPCLILIEGTFGDIWSAEWTVTYYSVLTLASFLGAATGPIIGNWILLAHDPAWISWFILFLAGLALAFGSGMPETYAREILRTRIHYTREHPHLVCSPSGVLLSEKFAISVIHPIKMFFTEPIVFMITLYLGLNFGIIFQWFVTVPVALGQAYNFTGNQAGLAFFAAVGGVIVAAVCCIVMDAAFSARVLRPNANGRLSVPIERRLLPAILGGPLAAGSLFWISLTVAPAVPSYVPILGTGVYVWGNAMVLISLISYLFDAYPATGVLSALTVAACFRLLCAAFFPIYILDIITHLPAQWAFGPFGGITVLFMTFPIILYVFGASLRARSKYNQSDLRTTVQLEVMITRQEEAQAHAMAIAWRALRDKYPKTSVTTSEWT